MADPGVKEAPEEECFDIAEVEAFTVLHWYSAGFQQRPPAPAPPAATKRPAKLQPKPLLLGLPRGGGSLAPCTQPRFLLGDLCRPRDDDEEANGQQEPASGVAEQPQLRLPQPAKRMVLRSVKTPLTVLPGNKDCIKDPTQHCYNNIADINRDHGVLCPMCRLPIGEFGYYLKDCFDNLLVHGECRAQVMLEEVQKAERQRVEGAAVLKRKQREEYDIGWHVGRLPRCVDLASKLGCRLVPQAMCCLAMEPESGRVRVEPTADPAAALNLEYLAVALRVRRDDGREPIFSLDPVAPEGENARSKIPMQVKRFEPEWLASTSVGQVLFQADYHLKELSMGEYGQPVVGMKSCFELSDQEGIDKAWRGREWFTVRDAGVQLSEDSVLLPHVRLGVEAREQLPGPDGLPVDARITREGHPMVKYAEQFSANFDLIAERRSSIFHLRELAKAAVLAKFLIDSQVALDEAWFEATAEAVAEGATTGRQEIPQLWNEALRSKIQVEDGAILDARTGIMSSMYGVYGGVDFGLDRFRLSTLAALGAERPAVGQETGRGSALLAGRVPLRGRSVARPAMAANLIADAALQAAGPPGAQRSPFLEPSTIEVIPVMTSDQAKQSLAEQLASSGITVRAGPAAAGVAMPTGRRLAVRWTGGMQERLRGVAAMQSFRPPAITAAQVAFQGVDLNLDQFNISASQLDAAPRACDEAFCGAVVSPEASAALGAAFWESTDLPEGAPGSVFLEEDRKLLRAIFNPCMSDRREEKDFFVPPSNQPTYVTRLRELVKAEAGVRVRRQEHFCSDTFDTEDAGPLFPASWRSTLGVQRNDAAPTPTSLRPRYDPLAQVQAERLLNSQAPAFDKSTEDGLRFRIYSTSDLEVRSIQDLDATEAVVAVFTINATGATNTKGTSKSQVASGRKVQDLDLIVKATQYVERCGDQKGDDYSYYVVLETEAGDAIVTEQLQLGAASWCENPLGLNGRNARAKVIRSASTSDDGETVIAMREYCSTGAVNAWTHTPHALRDKSRWYAQGVFFRALGGTEQAVQLLEQRQQKVVGGRCWEEEEQRRRCLELREERRSCALRAVVK